MAKAVGLSASSGKALLVAGDSPRVCESRIEQYLSRGGDPEIMLAQL